MISEDVREWVDEFARDAITKSTELGLVNYEAIAVLDWLGSQHEPEALRELMANEAHAVWANWMAYLFLQSQKDVKGRVVIPRLLVERWERQVATHYIDLTESEKEAVGTIADRYLKLMGGVA